MRYARVLAAAVACTATVSCATAPCAGDPATDSYGCAERGLRTGLYEQQLADLVAHRRTLQEKQQNLARENRKLTLRVTLLRGNRRAAAQQLLNASRKLDTVTSEFETAITTREGEAALNRQLHNDIVHLVVERETLIDDMIAAVYEANEGDAGTLLLMQAQISELTRRLEAVSSPRFLAVSLQR